ncbi:DUF6884 domain-containing protein [Brevibacillus dissolubilis]|uniref:DUF6884 domain-containing protein n=1 Tax=Brevibacillus dissolubilis TaxID=1844116 RepID=UPI0011173D4D|nr:DUF6884 domain-containing protein [Brevibacillus dissolubilis]
MTANTTTRRLCIIPCGQSKIWDKYPHAGTTQAKDAYTGAFHKSCQRYANRFFTDWVILSAKHGFLCPTDVLHENYDVGFQHKSDEVITIGRLQQQLSEKGLSHYDEITVLGGKKYVKVVEQTFGPHVHYRYPLRGCKGIGYMLQRLAQAVESGQE